MIKIESLMIFRRTPAETLATEDNEEIGFRESRDKMETG